MSDVQSPREELRERVQGGARRSRVVVRPEDRNTARPGVETLRVCANDVLVDATVTTLEDLAVPVDEEVVADVIPAVPLHVVHLDAAHDRGRLGSCVAVRPRGVVDERELQRSRVARRRPPDGFISTPRRTRNDPRRTCDRERARRQRIDRTPEKVRPQARDRTVDAIRDRIRSAGPIRVAEVPVGLKRVIGPVLHLRRSGLPRAPVLFERARAELDRAGSAPVESHHVEPRSGGGGEDALSAQRQLAHRDRRRLGARKRGCGKQNGGCEQKWLHAKDPVPGWQEPASGSSSGGLP